MTEQLTDNTDEWPVGPFELLGIPRTAERAEIRRAYSVLIRRFRPETHPKQFQRVREAFEAVLVAIETRGQNSADIRIDLTALIPREDAVALQRPLESQSATPVAASTFSDAADLVWSRFSNAPDVSQYNDIRKLTASAGRSADAFLMGYWMLRLRPDFAVDEQPADWLIRALTIFGADPRLVDLLVDEFRRDSALTEPLVSGDTAGYILSSELLSVYLHGRWNVIGRRRAWKQLTDEIDQARARLAFDHGDAWFRLLSRIHEMVAFAADVAGMSLLESIQHEINETYSARQRHYAAIDMLDMLSVIRKHQYEVLLSGSPALHQLLLDSTNLSTAAFRRRLFAVILGWVDSPLEALRSITQLTVRLPEGFWLLLRQVDGLGFFDDATDVRDPNLLEAICTMVNSCKYLEYSHARITITEFCRDECVSGTSMVDALIALSATVPKAGAFAAALQQDTPLLLTCQMICRFLEASGPGNVQVEETD